MINFQTYSINNVSMPIHFKSKQANENPVENTDTTDKTSLDNPMETVGRSQVNFKGAKVLSAEDLNFLAQQPKVSKLSSQELKVLKETILNTMEEYKTDNFKNLFNRMLDSGMDTWAEFNCRFMNNAVKIDPKIDAEKLNDVILSL